RFAEVMGGYHSGKEIITSTEIDNVSVINMPARSALIIELYK
ncbi:MAG: cyclomaltodextrinase C-terminal domain-containing protein, partial [Prolixibacteraceae bacterium]|nr:cyclomaltodextrinase C-terminal domain-containing protein [Prolixibacteraceae bacterium]